jgi:hypothetical protein
VSDPAAGQACTPGASCLGGFCDGVTSTCVADTTLGSCGSKPALAGLTLFDAFHGTALDGTRWQNASFTRAVDAGAAVLGVEVDNERRRSDRNDNYASIVNVVGAGRVTTLQSTITVPAASAVATGGTVMRAVVRLLYSPPLNRLSFPGGNQDLFIAEVGLREEGSGLTAFRQFTHCDVASCASLSTSGVTYVDPAGFAPVGNGNASGAPAAHDTLYTATVSLDEVTGIFHWTIAGGAFGAGVSGTADPAAYLAGNAGWTGVAMAGAGYNAAQIGVRSNDDGAGGGSARLKARFDDVQVGRNNGAAAPFDDFGGTGDNSGPADLSPAKWNPHGTTRVLTSGGSLLVQSRAIAAAAGTIINGNGIPFGDPASVNAVQFLAGFESVTTTGTSGLGSVGITGRYYSDGTHTRANDATGDVSAFLTLTSTGLCTYGLNRCTNATCSTTTPVGFGVLSSAVTPGVHRLVSRWNPTARSFDFGVDGLTITVDPTTASAGVTAPVAYGAGPNAPFRVLSSSANVTAAAAGQSTAVTLRIVDVFTGP